MSFEIRGASDDEIEWLKIQLDPPAYYLGKFLALKKRYGAIELDTDNKASRLKGSLKRSITAKEMNIRVFSRESVVLLINDDIKGGKLDA